METSNYKKQIPNKKGGYGYTPIRTIRKNPVSVYAYTLIEILVTLTIIGLLFGFGYANFRDFSRRQVLSDAVKTIQGDLRFTQANAITGQKPTGCDLTKTLDSYSFKVVSETEYTILANCGSTTVTVKDVNIAPGITIAPIPITLNFKILGQGTDVGSSDWTLTLVQDGTANTGTVTVTSGGEIK